MEQNHKQTIKYSCPECRAELTPCPDHLHCPECKKEWPIKNSIPQFTESAPVWYLHDDDEFENVLEECRKQGWYKALAELEPEATLKWIEGKKRVEGVFYTKISPTDKVLDVGCGWGGLSLNLAKVCRELHCADIGQQGLRFINLRAEQEKTGNIVTTRAKAHKLPYADGTFDVVVISGVLEFTPSGIPDLPPREAQLTVLKELCRVMKDDGQIFIALENRFAYHYILGCPDEHTSLRWITLMPRWLGNIYHKFMLQKPFRHYIYSYWSLCRLIKDAGFTNLNFFTPFRTYRQIDFIIELDSPRMVETCFLNYYDLAIAKAKSYKKFVLIFLSLFIKFKLHYSFLRYLFPICFFVIGTKKTQKQKSFLETIILEAVGNLPDSENYNFLMKPRNRKREVTVYKNYEPHYHLSIDNGQNLLPHFLLLKNIYETASDDFKNTMPAPIKQQKFGQINTYAFSFVEGKHFSPPTFNPEDDLRKIIIWLTEFRKLSDSASKQIPTLEELYKNDPLFKQLQSKNQSQMNLTMNMKACFSHGDFSPNNILVHINIFRFIDWEHCDWRLPLYDWFYFLTFYYQSITNPGFQSGSNPLPIWDNIYFTENPNSLVIKKLTEELICNLNIDKELLPILVKANLTAMITTIFWSPENPDDHAKLVDYIIEKNTVIK